MTHIFQNQKRKQVIG